MVRKPRWEEIDADASTASVNASHAGSSDVDGAIEGVKSISIGGASATAAGELPPSEKHGPDAEGVLEPAPGREGDLWVAAAPIMGPLQSSTRAELMALLRGGV